MRSIRRIFVCSLLSLKVKENQRQELKEAMQGGSRLFISAGKARTI